MNSHEFQKWWTDFKARFPSKNAWLENSGSEGTLEVWCDLLADTELEWAISANRAIHRGEYDWPDSWDLIPQAIVDIADREKVNAIVRRSAANEPDLSGRECDLCKNTGIVECWEPRAIWQYQQGREYKKRTVGVACKCFRGDKFSSWGKFQGKRLVTESYFRFDEQQWCLVVVGRSFEDSVDEWLASRQPLYDFGEYGA